MLLDMNMLTGVNMITASGGGMLCRAVGQEIFDQIRILSRKW